MILIIDGNNLAHRCKHVFSLSNKGVDVSVTYGFIASLRSMMTKWKPSSVIVCWDFGIPEFRRVAVPEYKANRHTNDDPLEFEDFVRQLNELHDYALPLMGIISIKRRWCEADDLIYHVSRMLVDENIVVSSDKDLLQCINNSTTTVFNPSANTLYTREIVESMIGSVIHRFVDWKAIQGDSSDNIPGVVGIGEKTATKLMHEFGDISGIYNAALGINPKGEIGGKLKSSILAFGLDRLFKNVYVMALYADRVGAKEAILESMKHFQTPDVQRFKKYLMRNAFVSLLDNSLFIAIRAMSKPRLVSDVRVPRIVHKRNPVH